MCTKVTEPFSIAYLIGWIVTRHVEIFTVILWNQFIIIIWLKKYFTTFLGAMFPSDDISFVENKLKHVAH